MLGRPVPGRPGIGQRLQAVAAPDALHRADANSARRRYRRGRPARRLARWRPERKRHHALGQFCRQRRDARGPGLVAQQAVYPLLHGALLPAPHRGLGYPYLPPHLVGAGPVGRQQHDPGAPDALLRAIVVPQDASNRARSEALTSMIMPACVAQTCPPASARESQAGLFRQG